MQLKKLRVLMDLEMMRLELIPFSVSAQDVIAEWPEDRKRKFFRKFRKIARKAARHTAIREDKSYGKGTTTERQAWIKRRAEFLFNRPPPAYNKNSPEPLAGRKLQQWRFAKRRSLIENWMRREIWRKILREEHA
tara:strand:+ start:144 stop:548 length:405 start_codon:yes stop_codon:yes gene_type:complete